MHVLWRQRWIVVACVALSLCLAAAHLLTTRPLYTSTSRLYVQPNGPRLIGQQPDVTVDNANFLHTQCQIMTSTPILAIVLGTPGTRDMKSFEGVDNLLDYLKSQVRVDVGKQDDIINVEFDSPYPEEAARVVNRVVDAYSDYVSRQKRTTAAEMLKVLNAEKTQTDADLTTKGQQMAELKKQAGTLSFDPDRENPVSDRLREYNDLVANARAEAVAAKASYDDAVTMYPTDAEHQALLAEMEKGGGGVVITSDSESISIRSAIFEQEQKLDELSRVYGPKHPLVVAAQGRRDHLLAQYVVATKRRWAVAAERQAKLEEAYGEQQKLSNDFADKAARFNELVAETNRLEKHDDVLDNRIKEIQADEGAGPLNITVLEPARPEPYPSKPSKSHQLAFALLVGLALGAAAAHLREWTDPRFRSTDEIRSALGLHVLGAVPHVAGARGNGGAHGLRFDRFSETAESYRTIRTALQFRCKDAPSKTLLVTSPQPGDGKTTLAANLAIATAQSGKRVLLVDADFRRPSQHKLFHVDGRIGLSDVLDGEPATDAVRPSAVDGLDILPAGAMPHDPCAVLNSQRFPELLEELSKQYDLILIDSAPATVVSDARVMGASCDATVMVVRAGWTDRRRSEQAYDGLMSVGARVVGVVVNDVAAQPGYVGAYYRANGNGNGNGHTETIGLSQVTPARREHPGKSAAAPSAEARADAGGRLRRS